jgi:hypothetical protein
MHLTAIKSIPPKATQKRWLQHFAYYNLIFFILQLAIIIYKSKSFISTIPLPTKVYIEIGLTCFTQISLYALLSYLQALLMFSLSSYSWKESTYQRLAHCITWGTCLALLTTNAYFFPLSQLSRILFSDFPPQINLICMLITWTFLGLLLLNMLLRMSKQYSILCGIVFIAGCILFFKPQSQSYNQTTTTNQPNIILIGVDSLSPRSVNSTITPNIHAILKQSVWFKETISPLARTYPAWSTILTGLYPEHHRARYNLIPHALAGQLSIAWDLQKQGYQTVFATDDRRFNILDKEFGFQTIVGPKRGVNDILMGTFNDFPLSNLFINTPIGGLLFPYNHMNRASYFSYYPKTFDKALKKKLSSRTYNQPLFMAVHFTLPHWPYAFASSTNHAVNDPYNVMHKTPLYHAALRAADKQVATLMSTLNELRVLDNSIVIILSDHGETLYTPGSRQTTKATYQGSKTSRFETQLLAQSSTELNKSAGHGSDLLSADQYHCVLGFQLYKNKHLITIPSRMNNRVALLDIAPTLLEFIHIKPPHTMDGISLYSIIRNSKNRPPARAFIMESGMLPNQKLLTVEKTQALGKQLFKVTPKQGLLQIRTEKLAFLDSQKLYAILKDDWILALYPTHQGYLPIVQQISTGAWIDDLTSSFGKNSPALSLLHELEVFYQHTWPIISAKKPSDAFS